MQLVGLFRIEQNRFEGELPEMGLHAMARLGEFSIYENGFEGALPEIGLQAMRWLGILNVDTNRFAGDLPDLRELTELVVFSVGNTCIQGHMSQISLSSCFVDAIVCQPLLDRKCRKC
eukprot:2117030-Amphidinium_carterae.1